MKMNAHLLLSLILVGSSCASSPGPTVKLVTSGAPPKQAVPFLVPIVELNGTGSEMGAEHGFCVEECGGQADGGDDLPAGGAVSVCVGGVAGVDRGAVGNE